MKKIIIFFLLAAMLLSFVACSDTKKTNPYEQDIFGNDDDWIASNDEELPPIDKNLKAADIIKKGYETLKSLEYYQFEIILDRHHEVKGTENSDPISITNSYDINIYKKADGVSHVVDSNLSGAQRSTRITYYAPYMNYESDFTPLYMQLADTRIDSALPVEKNSIKETLESVNYLEIMAKSIYEYDWNEKVSLIYKDNEYVILFPLSDFYKVIKSEENNIFLDAINATVNGFDLNDDIILVKISFDTLFRMKTLKTNTMYTSDNSSSDSASMELKSINFDIKKDTFFTSLLKSIGTFNKTNGIMLYVPKDLQTFKTLSSAQQVLYKGYSQLEYAKSYKINLDVNLKTESSGEVTNYNVAIEKQTAPETAISVLSFDSNLSGDKVTGRSYLIAYPTYFNKAFRSLLFKYSESLKEFEAESISIRDPRRVDYQVTEPALQFMRNDLGTSTEIVLQDDGAMVLKMEFNKFYNIINSTTDNIFKDILHNREISNLTRNSGIVVLEFDKSGRIIKISMSETRFSTTKSAEKYYLSFECIFSDYDNIPYVVRTDLQAALDKFNQDTIKNGGQNYSLPSSQDNIHDIIDESNTES